MTMVYQWRKDSRFPVGAQIAAERLNKIRSRYGSITPHAVVDDAADPKSPLHLCFEWDDEIAAENFRLVQARKLIGAIVVAEIDDRQVAPETRAFVHITVDSNVRYEPIEIAMVSNAMRDEVLGRAKREIKLWRARYAAYEEFADLMGQIDAL